MYRTIAAVFLSTITIAFVPPAPAVAATGVLSLTPGAFIRDVVVCPAGKVAVAGGASVVGEGTRDFHTVIQETGPGGALWLIALRNNDSVAHNVAFSAVCVTTPPGYEVVRKDFVVGASAFGRSFAQCPEGKVVFGGGAYVVDGGSRDFRTIIRQTAPDSVLENTLFVWRAGVFNNNSTAHTIAVLAVCANRPFGYGQSRTDFAVGASAFLRAAVLCPTGRVILGGGSIALVSEQLTTIQESNPGTRGGTAVVNDQPKRPVM